MESMDSLPILVEDSTPINNVNALKFDALNGRKEKEELDNDFDEFNNEILSDLNESANIKQSSFIINVPSSSSVANGNEAFNPLSKNNSSNGNIVLPNGNLELPDPANAQPSDPVLGTDVIMTDNLPRPISTSTEHDDEIKIYCGLPDATLNTCQLVVEKVSQYFADNIACFWSIFPLNEPHKRMGNWKLGEYLDRWFRSDYENCLNEVSKMVSSPDFYLIERLLKFQLKSCSWTAHNNYLQYSLIRLCMERDEELHVNLLLRYFILPPHLWSRISYFVAELLEFASGIYPDYDVIVSELTDSYDLVHRMNPVQLALTAIYMGETIVPKHKRDIIFSVGINNELLEGQYTLLELMSCMVVENCMKKFCESEMIKFLMNRYAPLIVNITDNYLNSVNSLNVGDISSFRMDRMALIAIIIPISP